MTLIGLYSPVPQSGKSTFAKALLGMVEGSQLIKFAEGFRAIAIEVVSDFFEGGVAEVEEWLEDDRKDNALIPELGVTLRHVLQEFGTAGRRINPDLWVLKAKRAIRRASAAPLVVVDDMRMANEYAMLRKLGAATVRVYRPDAPATPPHSSNEQLDCFRFDYYVTNDTCPTELCMQAQRIGRELGLTA